MDNEIVSFNTQTLKFAVSLSGDKYSFDLMSLKNENMMKHEESKELQDMLDTFFAYINMWNDPYILYSDAKHKLESIEKEE